MRAEEETKFAAAVADTVRFRDARVAELLVLATAYVTTYALMTGGLLQAGSTWYAPESQGKLTYAGYWYALLSMPIFQFLLFRWVYRMAGWTRFLWKVSKLDLQLTPTHPDGAAGLGFLGKGCAAFGLLLFPTSAVVSSAIASRILFDNATLESFGPPYAGLLIIALVVFAGPLLIFLPILTKLKRRGLLEYGWLASRYTQLFERKWVEGTDAPTEPLLGTADLQSLADPGGGYEIIQKMRVVPIQLNDFIAMVIPGVLPALPLAATVMPVSEIAKNLLSLFF